MSLATDMVAFYLDAEKRVLKHQSVQFGERQLTLADLPEIREGRREWESRVVAEIAAGCGRDPRYSLAVFN